MDFTSRVPRFRIDLGTPEADRWREVIDRQRVAALRLAEQASTDLERATWLARSTSAKWIFSRMYQLAGGPHVGEMQAWANGLGSSLAQITTHNCVYELGHAGGHATQVLGCTAGVTWLPSLGMVHLRTLDWGWPSIGPATGVHEFCHGTGRFVSVGIAGFVGVLSGLVPGAWSASINWAPPVTFPGWAHGPASLLRRVLSTCDTYEDAVLALSTTPLASSVFYVVCGVDKGQACVIERTREQCAIREYRGVPLAQANHFATPAFQHFNWPMYRLARPAYDNSWHRSRALCSLLTTIKRARKLASTLRVVVATPVAGPFTRQAIVFHPSTGTVAVLASTEGR